MSQTLRVCDAILACLTLHQYILGPSGGAASSGFARWVFCSRAISLWLPRSAAARASVSWQPVSPIPSVPRPNCFSTPPSSSIPRGPPGVHASSSKTWSTSRNARASTSIPPRAQRPPAAMHGSSTSSGPRRRTARSVLLAMPPLSSPSPLRPYTVPSPLPPGRGGPPRRGRQERRPLMIGATGTEGCAFSAVDHCEPGRRTAAQAGRRPGARGSARD